jgi:hypothetical protein
MDNVFIERLWRSVKYECVYLHAFETGSELRAGLGRWFSYYNHHRLHSALAGRTPAEAYGHIDASDHGGHGLGPINRIPLAECCDSLALIGGSDMADLFWFSDEQWAKIEPLS